MLVSQVRPGQTFRVGGKLEGFQDGPGYSWDFRMIRVGMGSAYVEPLGRVKKKITKKDEFSDLTGREEVLAEFDSPTGGKIHISRESRCIVLDEGNDDEDLTGPRPEQVPKPAATKKPSGADIHHDPQAPQRAVRPGTVREKVLKLILAGGKGVDKMASELDMKRTLFLAHLWELHNSCGYGYTVTGDKVLLVPPVGDDAEDLL